MSGVRVLLILGGIYHDFEGFASTMEPVLRAAGHAVDATYDLDALTRLDEGKYDLIVSYTSLSRHREGQDDAAPEGLSESQTQSLIRWVRGGGALLALHCATVSGRPNPALASLIGGVFVSHPPQFSFLVVPMVRDHPLTQGIEAFSVKDELYIQEYDPSVDIHMVALDRGIAYPMAWSKTEGQGRVAHIALGHSSSVWNLKPYQQLMLQAIAWLTAGRKEEGR